MDKVLFPADFFNTETITLDSAAETHAERPKYPSFSTEPTFSTKPFQRDCLYVIAGLDAPHGLAVKDELNDYYEKEIHHGRLYPNLDTLVEKGQRDQRTNIYTLTRRGHREIEARRDWETQQHADTVEA